MPFKIGNLGNEITIVPQKGSLIITLSYGSFNHFQQLAPVVD